MGASNVPVLSAESPMQTPLRKRLRTKTGAESPSWSPEAVSREASPLRAVRVQPWRVLRQAAQLFAAHWMRAGNSTAPTYQARRAEGRLAFGLLEPVEQQPWLERARVALTPSEVPGTAVCKGPPCQEDQLPGCIANLSPDARCAGMLFTWNGHWLDEARDVQQVFSKEAAPLETDVGDAWARLSAMLAASASVQQLLSELWEDVSTQCRRLGFLHLTVSVELSTHSVAARRLHLHAFLSLPATHKGVRPAAAWHAVTFRGKKNRPRSSCLPWQRQKHPCEGSVARSLLPAVEENRFSAATSEPCKKQGFPRAGQVDHGTLATEENESRGLPR